MYIPVCFYCLSCTVHLGCEWTGQPADHTGGDEKTATQLSGSQIMLEFSRGEGGYLNLKLFSGTRELRTQKRLSNWPKLAM